MTDIIYTLKSGFEYANKGEIEKAQFITLLPPTAKYMIDIAPIKSYVLSAITWAQNQKTGESDLTETVDTDEEESSITSEMLMTILDLAPEVDMAKLMLHMNSMLIGGLAKIDGEVKYTKPVSDNLSIDDSYGLAGCFLVNFIIPSLS